MEDIVELQFEHAEWRPVIMNPVREAYADQVEALSEEARAGGATHFVRRVLDPKVYNFRFSVNNQMRLSGNYDQILSEATGNEVNTIDLTNAQTKIFVKKRRDRSDRKKSAASACGTSLMRS